MQSSIGSSNAALPGSDPEHAQRVQAFHNDAGAVSPEAYDALMKAVNPDGMNANAVRDAMNKIYGFYASKGDRAAASKAAGGVLQAARARSREYGKMAGDALQQRNYPLAARALMASYNEMPDGKRITAEVNEQGEGRAVVYDNDTDKPVEQFPLNPKVLGMATMRAMAGGERVFEVLDTPPRIQDRPDAIELDHVEGRVDFDHVSFHYVEGVPILRDIDLHVAPGETIAFVGHTGAGKTTITSLVSRGYEVTGGAIRIDGHDLRDIKRRYARAP